MNKLEFFNEFLEEHPTVEWQTIEDEKTGKWILLLRRPDLQKYEEEKDFAAQLTQEDFSKMPKEKLYDWIGGRFNVDGITRITGYFAKTRSFNPGKDQERRDRIKQEVSGQQECSS